MIVPNESKMSLTNYLKIIKNLQQFIDLNYTEKNKKKLKKIFEEIEGYLLIADRKNLEEYFSIFMEKNIVKIFQDLLYLGNKDINFLIMKTICSIIINIQNQLFKYYIYSSKIINQIFILDNEGDEDFLIFQINFMKSFTLRINKEILYFFYFPNFSKFPILDKALSLYDYKDLMVRNTSRNIFLSILKINDNKLINFLTSFPICVYYPNLVLIIRNLICEISKIKIEENKKNVSEFQNKNDDIVEILYYISDILSLNIESINFLIINTLLQELILPLINNLIKEKKDFETEAIIIYYIVLILYTIKYKFVTDIICIILFDEQLDEKLIEKIKNVDNIKSYDNNLFTSIKRILSNINYTDINDEPWTSISNFINKITGVDLGNGQRQNDTNYTYFQNYLLNRGNEKEKLNNNPFLIKFKDYFKYNDDSVLLLFNILIYCIYEIYTKVENKNLQDIKEKNNKLDKNNNSNEINTDNNKKTIVNNKKNFNTLKDCLFFSNLNESNNSFVLFNHLISLLYLSNKLRTITDDIILSNINRLIIYINENIDNGGEYITKIILQILKKHLSEKISKIKNTLNNTIQENLRDLCYEYTMNAYTLYTKTQKKKVNDLITLPWLLIPIEKSKKISDYPNYLLPNENEIDIITNDIMIVYYIHDIIQLINKNKDTIIKDHPFPLLKENISKFLIGKIYNETELDDYTHCIIEDFKNPKNSKKCELILTDDTLYIAENLANNFDNVSKVKIIKQIHLRRLKMIPQTKKDSIIDFFEYSKEIKNVEIFHINAFKPEKTKQLYLFLLQKKNYIIDIEINLVKSFLDCIEEKINKKI